MRTRDVVALEWLAAWLVFGCARTDRGPSPGGVASALPLAAPSVQQASAFVCEAGVCTQRHVRLPDSGEWRCAERDGTVWCAGGEPAAGVVPSTRAHGYLCGKRRGASNGERICVDAAPDYPDDRRGAFRCHFESDYGMQRVCRSEAVAFRPLPSEGAPDCWLDRDCAAGPCERGYCLGVAP